MSLIAPVEDGKIVTQTTSADTKATGSSSGMDKESFLKLLVAQMQYQDPLEPTSNTEYVSQYAQFSQVESLQSMRGVMDMQRASALVGQDVYVQTTLSSGETKYIQGQVDYVTFEGSKAYVYVNEQRYSLDEVQTVVDPTYLKAYNMASDLVTAINKLPAIGTVDLSYAEKIGELNKTYQDMDDYQKSFVAQEKVTTLQAYVDKIEELEKLAAAAEEEKKEDASEETAESSESGEKTGEESVE